jgi:hypothetical protein
MRLSSLSIAAVLLLSVVTFAQHSSGGGGGGSSSSGSSGGSSGGGGGSHGGGSSGGSSGSGGGHSSSGSASSSSAHSSGGSSSHGSSGHSSIATPAPTHPGVNNSRPVSNSHTNHERSVREPITGARVKTEMPAKRSFFGFLRHPFRRPLPNPQPQPKPVADLRRPVCLRGPCTVCPPGQAHAGGCGGALYIRHHHAHCTSGEIWNGGECLLQTQFLDSCEGLRRAMQRQQQRMQAAESTRQSACTAGSSQGCLDSTSAAQSEEGFYRTLQERYQRCMRQSLATYPFAGFGFGGYSSGLLFDPLDLEFNYP